MIIIGTGVALAGSGLAIGSMMGGDVPTSSPPPATTPTGTVNVLTGKPGKAGKVLVVKIDNVRPARPAIGLNKADIVYGIQVEGGLSRLAAVFDTSNLPATVGPVRSARETDLQLLAQYNRPALAFSGAQSKLLPVLRSSPLIVDVRSGYYRSDSRPAPHNEYLRTKGVANGAGVAKDIGLRFGKAPAGGTPGTHAVASMPSARFAFDWSGGRYRVSMDGTASPWKADTVVIQNVSITESRYTSRTGFVPFSKTVGSGTATVYRDGKAYKVTWDRPTAKDGTTFKYNGKVMNFKAGQSWIILV